MESATVTNWGLKVQFSIERRSCSDWRSLRLFSLDSCLRVCSLYNLSYASLLFDRLFSEVGLKLWARYFYFFSIAICALINSIFREGDLSMISFDFLFRTGLNEKRASKSSTSHDCFSVRSYINFYCLSRKSFCFATVGSLNLAVSDLVSRHGANGVSC